MSNRYMRYDGTEVTENPDGSVDFTRNDLGVTVTVPATVVSTVNVTFTQQGPQVVTTGTGLLEYSVRYYPKLCTEAEGFLKMPKGNSNPQWFQKFNKRPKNKHGK